MDSESQSQKFVLVAVAEELREIICNGLRNESLTPINVFSPDEIQAILAMKNIQALVIESNWLFNEEESKDLIELTQGKIPTVTLIEKDTLQKYSQEQIYTQIYSTKLQEFCTIPFTMDELTFRLHKVISNTKK